MPRQIVIDCYEWQVGDIIRAQIGFLVRDISTYPYQRILRSDLVPWLEQLHAGYFARQVDPANKHWPKLAPSTIRKKGHDTILIDTTRLIKSLAGPTADSIRHVSQNTLEFGTAVPYAAYHQEGSVKWLFLRGIRRAAGTLRRGVRIPGLPPRRHVGLNNTTSTTMAGVVADALVRALSR